MSEDSIRTKKQLLTFISKAVNESGDQIEFVSNDGRNLIVKMHGLSYKIRVSKA